MLVVEVLMVRFSKQEIRLCRPRTGGGGAVVDIPPDVIATLETLKGDRFRWLSDARGVECGGLAQMQQIRVSDAVDGGEPFQSPPATPSV